MATVTVSGSNPHLPDEQKQKIVTYLEGLGPCGMCGSTDIDLYLSTTGINACCGNEICKQVVIIPLDYGVTYVPVEVRFK